ncbi:MAG: hypothetical protein KGJ41_02760 [Rhodospirillales bacterium]|nr:hypothetical protein [Rhodospirillales bacterium]
MAQNQAWLGLAVLACSVSAIDGVPVPFPGNETQIEALVDRLDEEGLSAIAAALRQSVESRNGEFIKN